MYFDVAASARLATIEQYHQVSNLFLKSAGRWISLYAETTRAALGALDTAGASVKKPDAVRLQNLFLEHLYLADDLSKDVVRAIESQVDTSSQLLKSGLDKAKGASPPLLEMAIDNAEAAISQGARLANEISETSLRFVGAFAVDGVRARTNE